MATPPAESGTLEQLQTPEQVALLDAIDELRSQGLSDHGIHLPQLIVCGEQSTGKSSLLEGLTRLRFPTKSIQCTTFATELVLRPGREVRIVCSIAPSTKKGDERPLAQHQELTQFERTFNSKDDFKMPAIIEEARGLMLRGTNKKSDSLLRDVLTVKYSGPNVPSLTIVDLPGMIKSDKAGTDRAKEIKELVTSYMKNERSIILAVVMAGNDPENQKPIKYIQRYDPDLTRSVGVITKPDRADKGSEAEQELLKLARNEKFKLKHGWYAVRNRDFISQAHTDAERDETETTFFSSGAWASHPPSRVGINVLRAKLSEVVLDHISLELPSLSKAINGAVKSTESDLKALGNTRETAKEQRDYLTEHAVRFQILTNEALHGVYSDPFFKLGTLEEDSSTRLRTTIQNLNIAFAHTMYQKGHTWDIDDTSSPGDDCMSFADSAYPYAQLYETCFEEPEYITRINFLETRIGAYVRQSRPSGLLSLVNPLVIGEVFRAQSEDWSEIAKHHLQQVFFVMKRYLQEVLGKLLDGRTCSMLMLKHVQPELERRWRNVELKLEELLMPYHKHEPLTYDLGFLREREESRAARYRGRSETQKEMAAPPLTFDQGNGPQRTFESNQRLLTESLDHITNSDILDMMQSYYKSAISVFINNIAALAVENCLIKDLSAIFSPTLTASMDDVQLHAIAAESEDIQAQRAALRQKLAVLQSSKQILDEQMATRPTIRALARTPLQRLHKSTRPETPKSRTRSDTTSTIKPNDVNSLASHMNIVSLTPPPSAPGSRVPSRSRHDSLNGSPPSGSAKKLEPRRSLVKRIEIPLSSGEL